MGNACTDDEDDADDLDSFTYDYQAKENEDQISIYEIIILCIIFCTILVFLTFIYAHHLESIEINSFETKMDDSHPRYITSLSPLKNKIVSTQIDIEKNNRIFIKISKSKNENEKQNIEKNN